MTLVKISLPIRVTAYFTTLIIGGLGTPTLVYMLATGRVTPEMGTLLAAVVSLAVTIGATLALSHLTLPDTAADVATALPTTLRLPALVEPVRAAPTEPATTTSAGVVSQYGGIAFPTEGAASSDV